MTWQRSAETLSERNALLKENSREQYKRHKTLANNNTRDQLIRLLIQFQ